jgi:hypothetical protein
MIAIQVAVSRWKVWLPRYVGPWCLAIGFLLQLASELLGGVLILHSDRSRAVHSRSLAPALGGIAGLRPRAYQAAVGMGVQTVVTSLAEGFSGSCK